MMRSEDFTFIRVTDVRRDAQGIVRATFYQGDLEKEEAWVGEEPAIGDVFEKTQKGWRKISSPQPGEWGQEIDALRWRKPVIPNGLSRMEILRRRHLIRQAVRAYLDSEGFTEIDSPLLVRGTTPDPAVESFKVGDQYLVTSTEYQMKRLVVGGMEKVYSLTQNFRPGDTGAFRNPEFTMLEWGRVGGRMPQIEKDTERFVLAAMERLGLPKIISYQGHSIDMSGPWERMSVSAAIEKLTGVRMEDFEAASCQKAAEAAGLTIRPDWVGDRDFLFSLLMEHLQPRFGQDRPVFLCDWPFYQTTSASAKDDGTMVDRSELFIAGIELGDGFAGLANPEIQAQLFDYAQTIRQKLGQATVDLDPLYMKAMRSGAPYGAGMALGFDRLVMLLTDQPIIKNVLTLAWDEL